MLEDSDLYVSRTLANLASILLLSPGRFQVFSLILKSLICFLVKARSQFPLSLRKSHLLHVRAVGLASAHCNCASLTLARNRQDFSSQPLHNDEWHHEILLVHGAGHVELFRADVQSSSCSLNNQLNRFVKSKTCRYTLRVCNGMLKCPKDSPCLRRYRTGGCEHFARSRHQLVRTLPMQNCSTEQLHSREAATGWTYENCCCHRHALNPLMEQTFRSHPSHCWRLITCLPDNSGSLHAYFERKRDRAQECQFVEVEVVSVALKQSKSVADNMME